MPREENLDPPSVKSSVRPTAHYVYITPDTHHVWSSYVGTDDRFIMKQIKNVEISSFEQTAPLYFEHITSALENKVVQPIPYLQLGSITSQLFEWKCAE